MLWTSPGEGPWPGDDVGDGGDYDDDDGDHDDYDGECDNNDDMMVSHLSQFWSQTEASRVGHLLQQAGRVALLAGLSTSPLDFRLESYLWKILNCQLHS